MDAPQAATDEAAMQATRTLSQAMGTYEIDAARYNGYRDRCMADNVAWIVQREEGAGHGKVMIAAHNGHIAQSGRRDSTMGGLLSERFGNRYWAFLSAKAKLALGMSFQAELWAVAPKHTPAKWKIRPRKTDWSAKLQSVL